MFVRELRHPVRELKGIGPRLAQELQNLGIFAVKDLLLYYPRAYEDRSRPVTLSEGANGIPVNTVVEVVAHQYIGWGKKKTLKVYVRDDSATASLVCFGRNFLAQQLVPGKKLFLYGSFQYRYGELQSTSFEFEPYSDAPSSFRSILPVYPLSGNLSQGVLRKAMRQAVFSYAINIENELPERIIRAQGFLCKGEALKQIHFPDSMEKKKQAEASLVFEELFYLQLIVGRRAQRRKTANGEPMRVATRLQQKLIKRLPFSLTPDQKTVLEEIAQDMAASVPMARLLQGDVGSGKTLVAFLSCLPYIEAGFQVAFMAPTELLARQHAENAAKLLEPLGVRLAYLSGNVKQESRKHLLRALAEGTIDLIIGTHALFMTQVVFKNLRFVIVDEQHRFGVLQRIALMEKGRIPDLLLMTATPIPRTMALTAFGDLDISTIKTMPPSRKPVITHLARQGNEGKVYAWVKKEVRSGRQAYFVYPLIQQSEKLSLKDAQSMFDDLKNTVFREFSLGLIHSKVPDEEKAATMSGFVRGEIQILVATSVVEVGVDVPNATCMVIEHAERFGLSALHQLRGRVGRGEHQSYAFLIYNQDLTEEGKKRLLIMKEYSEGFRIAEEDLSMRGPGDMLGTRQSGFLNLTIADLARDTETLVVARQKAFSIVEDDPAFLKPENSVIRDVFARVPPFETGMLDGG